MRMRVLGSRRAWNSAPGASQTEISAVELKQRIDRGDALVIVDVREPNEYQINRIPGSVLIPLGELPRRYQAGAGAVAAIQEQAGKPNARLNSSEARKRADLLAVRELTETGRLSLDGLITHHAEPMQADAAYRTAFGDSDCLKMVLDWRHCQ